MEMKGFLLWDYRNGAELGQETDQLAPETDATAIEKRSICLGGEAFRNRKCLLTGNDLMRPVKKLKPGEAVPRVEQDLIDFLSGLESEVAEFLS